MKYIKTDIEGVFIIEPRVFNDSRGYFFESWQKTSFQEKWDFLLPSYPAIIRRTAADGRNYVRLPVHMINSAENKKSAAGWHFGRGQAAERFQPKW